jgi:hypothetical protein
MLNPTAKAARVANLEKGHKTMNAALTSSGQPLAVLAAAVGVSQDLAERQLSVLVDEGLATRTRGSRNTALYASA